MLVTLAVAVHGSSVTAHTVTPVNPNASPDAVKALDFLAHINDHGTRTTQSVASGFFAGYDTNLDANQGVSSPSYPQVLGVRAVTGKWPFVLGCDYAVFDPLQNVSGISYTRCNSKLRSWWRQGGMVSVSVHLPNPYYFLPSGGHYKVPLSTQQMEAVLNPNLPEGAVWRQEIRAMADGLENLGVPVLFRPLHEMNGNFFWWGKQIPDLYRRLWRSIYDYMTNERRLTNVIWVYSPNWGIPWIASPGCFAYDSSADNYYPGGDVVDIVGLDTYSWNPESDNCLRKDYDALVGLGKPFAFTEIGRGFSPQYCVSFPMDYRKWTNAIRNRFPLTTYFLAWNDCHSPALNFSPRDFMGDPMVVNRGDRQVIPPPPPPQPSRKWTSGSISWDGLGGVIKGKVASVSLGAGHLQIFGRGTDDRLYTNTRTNGVWGGWQGLGDVLTEPPTVLARNNGVIEVFFRGGDTRPYVRRWNGSAWLPAVKLGEIDVTGPIAAVSLFGGAHATLYIRSSNNEVYSAGHDGTTWSNWFSLGGNANAAPTAVARVNAAGQTVLEVYVRWADDNVRYRRADPSQPGYQPWVNLGGIWKDTTPVGVTVGVDHSFLFGITTDNTLHFQQYRNGDWIRGSDGAINTGWRGVGGSVFSQPAVIAGPGERIKVFARDANQQINSITWLGGDNRNWEAWTPLDGDTATALGVSPRAGDPTDSIDVLGVDAATGQPFHTSVQAAPPATQVSTTTPDAEIGEPAVFVVNGPPGAPVTWSSTRDGVPVENNANYGHHLDANGEFYLYKDPYSAAEQGSWVRQAHVGTETVQTAQVGFTVSPRQAYVSVDKATYEPGEAIKWTLSGPPNSQIVWFSTVDGAASEGGVNYNQYTDADGYFTFTAVPADARPGTWRKRVIIGNLEAEVTYEVTGPKPVAIYRDKDGYWIMEDFTFVITGPPNLPIYWSIWVNGTQTANNVFNNQYTNASGVYTMSGEWGGPVGTWVMQVSIGGQTAQTTFGVTGPVWDPGPLLPGPLITNHARMCLDIAGASTADGAQAWQWTCHNGPNQRWRTTARGELIVEHSGKCLQPDSAAEGAVVRQVTCNSQEHLQSWDLGGANSASEYYIVSVSTRMCLTVQDASMANGATVHMRPCSYLTPGQLWGVWVDPPPSLPPPPPEYP